MRIELLSKYNSQLIEKVYETYNSAFSYNVFQTLKKKDFLDFFNMGSKIYLLYEHNNIIAYAIFLIGKNVAEIISIGVDESYQGMGYGKNLIKHFVINNKNITKLNLEVAQSNFKAVSFYQAIGFNNVGIRKKYYLIRRGLNKGKKIDALILEMNIK